MGIYFPLSSLNWVRTIEYLVAIVHALARPCEQTTGISDLIINIVA